MTARPSALIGIDDLAARLNDPDTLVIDIRSAVDGGGRAAYEAGHIPGAVHSDYVAGGWRTARGGGAGMLPEPDQLADLLGGIGLTPDAHAVVVPAGISAGDFAAASRVFWTLRMAGHRHVSMLDGGFAAWAAAGLPVETGPGGRREAPPYPVSAPAAGRASVEEVQRALDGRSATLLDARNAASFAGDEKSPQAARGGRLPAARHQEGARAYDTSANRLKPRAELERLFGDIPAGPAIPYCNTGQQAATNWFVLSEILGRPDVKLYDGSMSEWTADPGRPVETGPA